MEGSGIMKRFFRFIVMLTVLEGVNEALVTHTIGI